MVAIAGGAGLVDTAGQVGSAGCVASEGQVESRGKLSPRGITCKSIVSPDYPELIIVIYNLISLY